jgi:hypothetical protein
MKLVKKVYTTSSTENLIDRSFKEIKKEKEEVSVKEIFKLYERSFFDIPKSGLYSHKYLVEKSIEYLEDGDYLDTKQQQIDELNQTIVELSAKIIDLEMSSKIKDLGRRIEGSN